MDLTQGDIKKQLIGMAVPAGTGLLFYTLYNVVDTFYAGLIAQRLLQAYQYLTPCILFY